MLGSVYRGKKVLITGHTGFKGSWLAKWLECLKADVIGFALDPPTQPNHFDLLNLSIKNIKGDIVNLADVESVFDIYQPEIVFHLAAQPMVLSSYIDTRSTFEINVMGTVNLFEASKLSKHLKAIINITTDKVYYNKEWDWGYRENDQIGGGHDPYSTSKACSELVTETYSKNNYPLNVFEKNHNVLVATCRAGNVIGGGDWGQNRLIPDMVRSYFENTEFVVRNPKSVRPWQHVLDTLYGYLSLGEKLLLGKIRYSGAWNFAPKANDTCTVEDIVKMAAVFLPKLNYTIVDNNTSELESNVLRLDSTKAYLQLNWLNRWTTEKSLKKTLLWYSNFYEKGKINTVNNLEEYSANVLSSGK